MAQARQQYKEVYAPRTISKALLKALVEALAEFKPGLPATSRKLRVKAIGAGRSSELEGPEAWKVIDSHPLAKRGGGRERIAQVPDLMLAERTAIVMRDEMSKRDAIAALMSPANDVTEYWIF